MRRLFRLAPLILASACSADTEVATSDLFAGMLMRIDSQRHISVALYTTDDMDVNDCPVLEESARFSIEETGDLLRGRFSCPSSGGYRAYSNSPVIGLPSYTVRLDRVDHESARVVLSEPAGFTLDSDVVVSLDEGHEFSWTTEGTWTNGFARQVAAAEVCTAVGGEPMPLAWQLDVIQERATLEPGLYEMSATTTECVITVEVCLAQTDTTESTFAAAHTTSQRCQLHEFMVVP